LARRYYTWVRHGVLDVFDGASEAVFVWIDRTGIGTST
jgi:hypothetical protein